MSDTPDVKEALREAVSALAYCSSVFNAPNFTDRHRQGPVIRTALDNARAALAAADAEWPGCALCPPGICAEPNRCKPPQWVIERSAQNAAAQESGLIQEANPSAPPVAAAPMPPAEQWLQMLARAKGYIAPVAHGFTLSPEGRAKAIKFCDEIDAAIDAARREK